MKRKNTPNYFSLHESTTDLSIGNISSWKPLWAQTPTSQGNVRKKSRCIADKDQNDNINIYHNMSNARTNTSMYNGILTAQLVNSTVYCAVCDSKSLSPTVGICIVNPYTSNLKITEISDSPTFVRTIHKLSVQNNIGNLEILIPISLNNKKTNFVKILEANLPKNASLNFIPDASFKTNTDSICLLSKSIKESERTSFEFELRHRKFGLSAACACVSFLQNSPDHVFTHEKFIVKFESSEDSMFISTSAIANLELVSSRISGITDRNLSLFKFLNVTVTKMGERLLKNNILQPLTNKNSLILRYEAVKEMVGNQDVIKNLRNEMKELVDMDSLFSFLCKKPKTDLDKINQQKINFVLLLKKTLNITIIIRELLKSFKSELIKEIVETFENDDIGSTLNLISECINDDCIWVNKPIELRNQKCYAVKMGHNGILDASRQLYKSLIDDVLKIIDDLSEKYNIPMETKIDNNRGFFILIKNYDVSFFQNEQNGPFINYLQKGNNVEVTTMDIIKINLRIESVLNEIFLMTEDAIDELIHQCRKFVSSYFFISEAFSLLDLMCAFSVVSTRYNNINFTCPEIEDNNIIMKECRHPLLEYLYNSDKTRKRIVVPNDFTIVSNTSRIQIITGPNLSGKSIYIKQLALNIILAQIGMLLPADFASVKVFNSLFTRISNDVTEPNMSTFSMEMSEMSFILQNADNNSLVIIDELGRGTSYKDGISLSVSIIEKLRDLRCVCMFVTHFVGIPKIFKNRPGIFEMHFGVNDDNNANVSKKFKLIPGINWISGYGISLIESTNLFPKNIIDDAKAMSTKLKTSKDTNSKQSENYYKLNTQNKLILNTYETLQQIIYNCDDSELYTNLAALENGFVEKYHPLEEDYINKAENHIVSLERIEERGEQHNHSNLIDFGYLL